MNFEEFNAKLNPDNTINISSEDFEKMVNRINVAESSADEMAGVATKALREKDSILKKLERVELELEINKASLSSVLKAYTHKKVEIEDLKLYKLLYEKKIQSKLNRTEVVIKPKIGKKLLKKFKNLYA